MRKGHAPPARFLRGAIRRETAWRKRVTALEALRDEAVVVYRGVCKRCGCLGAVRQLEVTCWAEDGGRCGAPRASKRDAAFYQRLKDAHWPLTGAFQGRVHRIELRCSMCTRQPV